MFMGIIDGWLYNCVRSISMESRHDNLSLVSFNILREHVLYVDCYNYVRYIIFI